QNRIPTPPAVPDVQRSIHSGAASSLPAKLGDNPIPAAAPRPVTDRGALPLVARAPEWQTLLETYNTITEHGRMVVLQGEAGIGKTRLAEEFLAHARAAGAITLAARAYEGEQTLAYGPLVAALRLALDGPDNAGPRDPIPDVWRREAAQLVPDLAGPGTPPEPPRAYDQAAQARFFEGIRQVLLKRTNGSAPGVLFFDDLQWADGATVEFLTYFARRLQRAPVCLLLAWRTEQQPEGRQLDPILAGASRAVEGVILPLGRLRPDAVAELVRWAAVVPPAETPALVARLYAETEGLPFFLREYLAALAGGSYAPGVDPWPLLGGVRDLLHSRLRTISETGLQVLTAAAVIGRSFDFDTVRAASGRTEDEAVAALEELITAGLIVEVRGSLAPGEAPMYDFTHDKLRVLVYAETSLGRRRLLHHRVAEALQNPARNARHAQPLAGRIAYHYHHAGNEERAAYYYKLAGDRARSLYANREALAHLQTALALGHPESVELHIALGDLHTLLGAYRAAINSYETAAGLAVDRRVAEIEHRLGLVYQRRGQWELATAHLATALDAYTRAGEPAARARVYTDWSLTALQQGAAEQAHELARQALALAGNSEDSRARARAHNALGLIASKRGDPMSARTHLEQSLALADALGDIEVRAAVLNNLALAHGVAGEIDRALDLAAAALDLCSVRGDRHREAAIHNNIADLLHAAGRADEAHRHVEQAVAILGEIGAEAGDLQPAIWMLSAW
ncbi:MAG TPA: AAA family ATPase, partial [Chloroflexia bacterium]